MSVFDGVGKGSVCICWCRYGLELGPAPATVTSTAISSLFWPNFARQQRSTLLPIGYGLRIKVSRHHGRSRTQEGSAGQADSSREMGIFNHLRLLTKFMPCLVRAQTIPVWQDCQSIIVLRGKRSLGILLPSPPQTRCLSRLGTGRR